MGNNRFGQRVYSTVALFVLIVGATKNTPCNGQRDVIIQDYNVLVLNQNNTEIGNQIRFRFTHVEDESVICCLT